MLGQETQVLAREDKQRRAIHAVGQCGQAFDRGRCRHFRQGVAWPHPVVLGHLFASQIANLVEQRMRGPAVGDLGFLEQREVVDAGQAVPEITNRQIDMTVDDFLFQQ
ncbi:hypothetical protein D3C86_2008890 [compost metagenome]